MSDALIFIIGSGVFAITTTSTLLYGYSWFNEKSVEAGVEDGADDPIQTGDPAETDTDDPSMEIGARRFRRQLTLPQTR